MSHFVSWDPQFIFWLPAPARFVLGLAGPPQDPKPNAVCYFSVEWLVFSDVLEMKVLWIQIIKGLIKEIIIRLIDDEDDRILQFLKVTLEEEPKALYFESCLQSFENVFCDLLLEVMCPDAASVAGDDWPLFQFTNPILHPPTLPPSDISPLCHHVTGECMRFHRQGQDLQSWVWLTCARSAFVSLKPAWLEKDGLKSGRQAEGRSRWKVSHWSRLSINNHPAAVQR